MGKTKKLLDDLSEEDINKELFSRPDDDEYHYEEWLKSDDYQDMVNEEFDRARPKYSDIQVDNAIKEAFASIMLPMEEIGIDVYEKLFREKFFENIQ